MATYYRSRQAILHHIAQFCLSRYINGQPANIAGPDNSFHSNSKVSPPLGTLVAQFCAGPNKWSFAWLVAMEHKAHGSERYLLESIEDREWGWCSNMELNWLPIDTVRKFPEWRWDDRQFKLNDAWLAVDAVGDYRPRPLRWEGHDPWPVLVVGKKFTNELVTRRVYGRKEFTKAALAAFVQECAANWAELRARETRI